MYEVKTQNFEGPLDLLLKLIGDKKLEVSAVSISSVVSQYLEILSELKKRADIAELAGFLEVASELVLLKSRMLLPREPEAADEVNLEDRLKEYEKFNKAAGYFEDLVGKELRSFTQINTPKYELSSTFVPPKGLDMDKLLKIFKDVLNTMPTESELPEEKIKFEKINVEAKHAEIKAVILAKRKLSFSELLKLSKTRLEVVVTFLAILEMIKAGTIRVLQSEVFDDIFIETTERETK